MNNDLHFGQAIKEFLERQAGGVQEAAIKLDYTLQSLYPIFHKRDVNTSLIRKVGEKYGIDLFSTLVLFGNDSGRDQQPSQMQMLNGMTELIQAKKRIAVLEAEKNGLEGQIKLLREMTDLLKARDK